MITKTALTNRAYLLRIKTAVARAVVKARKFGNQGVGRADVFTSRGRYSLLIVARVGGRWEAFDRHDNDVTETVLAGLRAFHAKPILLQNVRLLWPVIGMSEAEKRHFCEVRSIPLSLVGLSADLYAPSAFFGGVQ